MRRTARGAHRLLFSGAGLPRAAPGRAMDLASGEHAGGGRRFRRADFARAAPNPQFENRFAMPNAAPGGARPLNDYPFFHASNSARRAPFIV